MVISCKALDAVKVVERAKLMGVPAVQIGKVGGDKLTGENRRRRILRPADRIARRVVEHHRAGRWREPGSPFCEAQAGRVSGVQLTV